MTTEQVLSIGCCIVATAGVVWLLWAWLIVEGDERRVVTVFYHLPLDILMLTVPTATAVQDYYITITKAD